MKIKHPNFKHTFSSAPDPTLVPEHLIRKHWSLQVIEIYHIVICLILVVFTFGALSESFFGFILLAFLSVIFSASVFFSISDDYRFRKTILSAHIVLVICTLIATVITMNLKVLIIVAFTFVQGSAILATVFLLEKNKRYYDWCKSIANKD